eukprot:582021-Alexandrium_andersonii.AAC.1
MRDLDDAHRCHAHGCRLGTAVITCRSGPAQFCRLAAAVVAGLPLPGGAAGGTVSWHGTVAAMHRLSLAVGRISVAMPAELTMLFLTRFLARPCLPSCCAAGSGEGCRAA